jgi:hypothetical protein
VHAQPVPLAEVGVSPDGSESLTVTVVPSVAALPPFVTVSVKLPVPPRVSVAALAVFSMVSDGVDGSAVLTVTEPVAAVLSPPPLTLAVLVSDAPALAATEALIVIAA